jgi:regulator of sigma E protease
MLSVLISILGIIITILLVVGVHEFGHFFIARLCGIKVLRFSIGFGKKLFSWHDKSGTEYVLAAIPLGGYVKMLDENEGTVPENELQYAYNRQPVYKRMAVVSAGPIINFIFAAVLYWILFMVGFTTVKPIIGKIQPDSIASIAGLKPKEEIIEVDNKPTLSWYNATLQILMRTGDETQMQIKTLLPDSKNTAVYSLNLKTWHMDELKPDPLASLGITPFEPEIPLIIGFMQPNSPAEKSHLNIGDKILAVDTTPIKNWENLITLVSNSPDKIMKFKILRDNKIIILPVTIGAKQHLFSHPKGYLGIAPRFEWKPELLRHNQFGPIAAIPHALQETRDFINLNFIVLGKMFTGKISLQSLGGPITIFESAGTALNQGIIPFISFLAFLSIAIGFINIIPIPGLDGGHFLFQTIELILRRPISERTQLLFYRLGLILLVLLIIQAVTNDLMRL